VNAPGDGKATAMRVMARAMAIMWVMAMVARLAGNKEGKGNGERSMATAMRVAGDKEGNGNGGKSNGDKGGGKAMAMATKRVIVTAIRVVGK
jgi:hypothetical protein